MKIITIYIPYKNLLTKELPEHHQSHLLLFNWNFHQGSGVTGSNPGQVRFQDFRHRHLRELRKNYYYCYNTFLTTDIDLSMKYKRDIRFHYEILSSLSTPI